MFRAYHRGHVPSIAFSNGGRFLATANGYRTLQQGRTAVNVANEARLWNGRLAMSFRLLVTCFAEIDCARGWLKMQNGSLYVRRVGMELQVCHGSLGDIRERFVPVAIKALGGIQRAVDEQRLQPQFARVTGHGRRQRFPGRDLQGEPRKSKLPPTGPEPFKFAALIRQR